MEETKLDIPMLKPIGKANWPEPHTRHLLLRDGKLHTCTVCYGMHEPWWIVHTTEPGVEARPVDMLPTDRHAKLADVIGFVLPPKSSVG